MSETAERDDPDLWNTVKAEVTAGSKGGAAGEWSARKAQMAVQEYKKRGGGYKGERDPHNSLHEWTEEDWGTNSGGKSGDTHERYLPKDAREALTDEEYARTTARKHADTAKGRQHSPQPGDVAKKAAHYRDGHAGKGATRGELYERARKRDIRGRSKMSKAELERVLLSE